MNTHQYWSLCNHLVIIEGKSSRAAWVLCEKEWKKTHDGNNRLNTYASFKANRSVYNRNARLLSTINSDGLMELSKSDFNRLTEVLYQKLKSGFRKGFAGDQNG